MKEVFITGAMKARAKEYQEGRERNTTVGQNYTGISKPNSHYFGKIGELAVAKIFADHQLDVQHLEVPPEAIADEGDFQLKLINGTHRIADVKTASKGFHQFLSVTESQHRRHSHKYDIYIAVRLNGDIAEVWGYVSDFNSLKLQTVGRDKPTLERPLNEIPTIEELLKYIAKK